VVINTTVNNNYKGGVYIYGGTYTLANTIVANNGGGDCLKWGGAPFTSNGNNIVSDGTCNTLGLNGPGDLHNTNPNLGPLQNNGGDTETHALLSGSSAIDHVPVVSCTLSTDQRGVSRPQGIACDTGAFEYEPPKADATIVKNVDPSIAAPGDPITYTLTFSNAGGMLATGVVVTDIVPVSVTNTSVISTGAVITPISGIRYAWNVADLAPGTSGVITITGVLSDPLPVGTFTNTAIITTTAAESITTNNSSSAGVTVSSAVVNNPPSFTSSPVTVANEDEPYTYTVTASDPDFGDVLAITAPVKPAWLALTDHGGGTAELAGTPGSADVGDHAVTLQVQDNGGLVDTQSFTVSVKTDCTGAQLEAKLNEPGPVINLDGDCRYLITEKYDSNAVFDLWNKNNLTINGNGAVIERPNDGPTARLFYVSRPQNLIVENLTITGIDASTYGGAIRLYKGNNVTLDNIRFIDNTAAGNGAGLHTYESTNVEITNTTFDGNMANGGRGGGVYNVRGTLTVSNSQFTNNTATGSGAGLYIWGPTNVEITNTTFDGNTTATGRGGGVYNGRSTLIVRNTQFTNNTSAGQGAGLYTSESANVEITNATFSGNRTDAEWGGGMHVYNSTSTVSNTQFISNTAAFGGGLALYKGPATVYNTVFADNQATRAGAGLFAGKGSTTTVENSTFVDNFGNPKQAIYSWSTLDVQNSIIANHQVAIAAAGGADNPVTEDYNLYSGNGKLYKVYNAGTTITSGGHRSIVPDIEQHFVDADGYDYRLKSSSPAIDKGTLLNTTSDADGNPRPFVATGVDVGAYEFQGIGGPSLSIGKNVPYWVQANTPFSCELTVANDGLATANSLRITDTLPVTITFVGNASDGGSFDGSAVVWDIGSLPVGQAKTVYYDAQVSQDITDSDYLVASTTDGSVSASGKPVDIRVNNILVDSLNFWPNPDGFGFYNWGRPSYDTDLTVTDVYGIFGPEVCTVETDGSADTCVLSAAAEAERQDKLDFVTGGHCYGMAVGSLQFFLDRPFIDGRTTPADFQPGAATTFDLLRDNVRNMITHYAVQQFYRPVNPGGRIVRVTDGTPDDIVDFLLTNGFDGPDNDDAYTLSFRKRDGNGGHAVTPYALEDRGDDLYWLYVYDNNHPGNFERVIKIIDNTWIYEGAAVNL